MINRFSVHIGAKGKASPHSDYILGMGKYEHKQGIVRTGSGNMPSWAKDDPRKFWAAADEYERANGSTYKEHIISIPREIPNTVHRSFVKEWIEKELGDKHPYTFAIHETTASDGKKNPHAHIMYSPRTLDGIERNESQFFKRYNPKDPSRGGARKAETGMTKGELQRELLAQRERWEQHIDENMLKYDCYAHPTPERDTPNRTMAEIQMEQKLDTMIENHPWFISPKPLPPAPPPKVEPPPPPEPDPLRFESMADKYARENAQNAQNAFYIDDEPEPIPTPATPPPRPQETTQRDDSFDFGM